MQWFGEAKLGIFIHWGIYAVNGVDESWSFFNHKISFEDYMNQRKRFTASKYNPKAWADLIESSGAKYFVITTKHHDGVALYDTKYSDNSIIQQTPARRDVLTPFITEMKKKGLKTGLYFSLADWPHPDYPDFLRDSFKYKISEHPQKWSKFVDFCHNQISEITQLYSPDLYWFDGDWEHSAEEWQAATIRQNILKSNPQAIINGRLAGYGDYDTPEQSFPAQRPKSNYWELCMTTNDNWGYQPTDQNFKTPAEVISIFADCISLGGNLLLNIGPDADGQIPIQSENILRTLGQWNTKYSEAIFESRAGINPGYFYGPTTLSKDSTSLYLFISGGYEGLLTLKGLSSEIESITDLSDNASVPYKIHGKLWWSENPGLLFIDVKRKNNEPYLRVLKVRLKDKIVMK